ncbi:MAG: right-handed parallel beta-helix repeat-containing protein [Candidatus Eisenbacteria bacterium]|nr:right-handed parallel beta-helix repeat-containing protein [Candidatus Eisenbacteria bacterium]
MRTGLALLAAVVVTALTATHAAAQTVHVPADFSTIQAAIQSGATLVYVAEGTYPESLVIESTVTLLPEPPADPMAALPFPRVWGLAIGRPPGVHPDVYVRGFHFTGSVRACNSSTYSGRTVIEGCRLDAGFMSTCTGGIGETVHIRSCNITGDVYLNAYGDDFTNNTVRHGAVQVHSNWHGAVIRDNIVLGPSANGLMSTSGDSPGSITGNFVSGVTTGYTLAFGVASDNIAEDCGGLGFAVGGPRWAGSARFTNNVARRCGTGIGLFDKPAGATVNLNQVDSARTVGIHVGSAVAALVTGNVVLASGSHGILVEGYLPPTGNTVLHSGGDGIVSPETPERNVVGRSAGRGIVAPLARHNTVYLNGGAGLQLSGAGGADTVSHNIAHANGGHGLVWTGTGAVALACNDWYGNSSGATSGVPMGATDLSVHPYFCDLPADDARLSAGSPLLAFTACGPIGALGVGCTGTTSAGGDPPPAARLTASPNPTRGATELRWSGGGAACRVEVFDVTGALRLRAELPAGTRSWRWNGNDGAQRALPGGTYWVRRTEGLVREHARVTLTR